MTQEEKELLLQDLSARIPHDVMLKITHNKYTDETFNAMISAIDYCGEIKVRHGFEEYEQIFSLEQIKPYLFPLSSMTEEQEKELSKLGVSYGEYALHDDTRGLGIMVDEAYIFFEFCYKHHIDFRGLIPMGLAIDATRLGIY